VDDGSEISDLPFKLFGLPFLIAGLYFIFGRFWIDMRVRRNLRYAVTDRRVLIFKKGNATSKSIDLKKLPTLELNERADGSGTIRFGPATSFFDGRNFGIWQATSDATPQFIRVQNVRSVYDLVQKQSVA
jgi:hypothetical protein